MGNPRATRTTERASAPRRWYPWIVAWVALFVVVVGVLTAGRIFFGERRVVNDAPMRGEPVAVKAAEAKPQARGVAMEPVEDVLVDDDGKTLWVSPTDGSPLELAYLSPGAQIIVALRPQVLIASPEAEKVLAALGPLGDRGRAFLDDALLEIPDIEQLLLGFRALSDGSWETTLVARLRGGVNASEQVATKLRDAAKKEHGGQSYWLANELAYYTPPGKRNDVFVVASENSIADVIDLAGETPPLRRDIERLIAYTDADRMLTIVVAPNSLFSEGGSIFEGPMTRLREPLFWFLGDELSAATLSMNLDAENFFLELIATPTLDTSTERVARILTERLAQVPDKLEAYVVDLNAQPYGRHVVARFPAMVRKLAAYTRSGFDKDHAVLRCYLPAVAAHNLLMGAELTLAEVGGGQGSVAQHPVAEATSPSSAVTTAPKSVNEKLKLVTSLRFARDTLEAALDQLSKDVGVEIVIRGADLQADGITKNQSFGIDLSNKPAEEILGEILRLANPDKTATAANDAKQKLVYVITPTGAGGVEQVVVTTRAAATQRGDELPAVFRPATP